MTDSFHQAAPLAGQGSQSEGESVGAPVNRSARFQWCCENGCGVCGVKRIEFEYSRTETMAGELLESLTIPRLVSACCGAGLTMWDDEKEEQVDVAVEPMPLGVAR